MVTLGPKLVTCIILLVRETSAVTCERVQIWSTATLPARSSCLPVCLNVEGEEREREDIEPTSKLRRVVRPNEPVLLMYYYPLNRPL